MINYYKKVEYKMAGKHPGFKKVAAEIAKKEGVGKKAAGAILASASRKNKGTSSNPKLKKVLGKSKK